MSRHEPAPPSRNPAFAASTFVVALVLAMLAAPAHADVPWASGVSKERQTRANALFAEANELFAQQAHAPALDKYRAAVELWDHPLIEFNMAVTLVRLDRILEAADALDKALRYDAAPFPSRDQYQQALDYQRLVAGRVGTISATCEQPGATLSLDGKPWFSCPGTQTRRVLVGNHVVAGEATGFMPISRNVMIVGRDTAAGTYRFVPLDELVTLEYPSPRWLPWTVTGAGVAIGLGGLGFWLSGNDQMDQFHRDAVMICGDTCSPNFDENASERQLAAQRDRAYRDNHIGIAMMSVGGAVTIGGAVWAILNRPRRVQPPVEVVPTSGGAAARIGWRF